jgi:predicted histidine transporter YuiF (NhaC family)
MKLRLASLALLLALTVAPAFGQGCAMCYTGAAAAGQKSQLALNRAVLVLLIPAVTMLVGFVGMAFVYRRERENDSN